MANKRNELMGKISDLTEDEEILDAVKDFIDDMENQFNNLAQRLSEIDIDSLGTVCDVRDQASDWAEELY